MMVWISCELGACPTRDIRIATAAESARRDGRANAGAQQRGEFIRMAISGHRLRNDGSGLHRRMQIDFADPRRQALEYRQQFRFIHGAAGGDAKQAVIVGHVRRAQTTLHERYPGCKQCRIEACEPVAAACCKPEGLIGDPHRRYGEFTADTQQHLQQGGMQMEMLVNIDVVELEPGARERRELRTDFRFELPAQARRNEEARHHRRNTGWIS